MTVVNTYYTNDYKLWIVKYKFVVEVLQFPKHINYNTYMHSTVVIMTWATNDPGHCSYCIVYM